MTYLRGPPLFPPAGRVYFADELRTDWLNLIKRYNVDLLLQGHDHSYMRGQLPQLDQPEQFQTLVITSVSGPKQYPSNTDQAERYAARGFTDDRRGENGQFFQQIHIDGDTLTYRSYLANGERYDEASIHKNLETGQKSLSIGTETPATRTFKNTPDYSKANL